MGKLYDIYIQRDSISERKVFMEKFDGRKVSVVRDLCRIELRQFEKPKKAGRPRKVNK